MQRDHLAVLQDIEFALVQACHETEGVDDEVAEQVLRAAITRHPPADPRAERALTLLELVQKEFRSDISENLWTDGLRVVYTSLRRHSDCRPGETRYLDFVSYYVM